MLIAIVLAIVIAGVAAGLVFGRSRAAYVGAGAVWFVLFVFQTTRPLYHHTHYSLSDPGYWIVQVIFLGLCLGLAYVTGTASDRRRRRIEATA
ncbi:MAG: hypothetical protein M3256_26740 [Actinomycetota bacterium]|nr:hypothetical protein [Actinomycetota bacterium]